MRREKQEPHVRRIKVLLRIVDDARECFVGRLMIRYRGVKSKAPAATASRNRFSALTMCQARSMAVLVTGSGR